MIAVDTNILVYAHREDSPQHQAARAALAGLVESGQDWAIPWPCVHEFLAITTHQRIFSPPTKITAAVEAITTLVESGEARLLGEGDNHLERLGELLRTGAVAGPKVHDARIAAICRAHAVRSLWTADRDFSYFPELRTHNPLVTTT